MKQIVNVDLTTRTTDWSPPTLSFGEDLTLCLYFTKDVNGNATVPNLNYTSGGAKAAIGYVDARPLGGQFALHIGSDTQSSANTTALIQYNEPATTVAAAINALSSIVTTYGAATVQAVNGSWLIHFAHGDTEVPLEVVQNGLWPVSLGHLGAWQVNNKWVHEVRLVQAPLAFTSSNDVVAPSGPQVTELRAGGTNGSAVWDELQQLYLPPDFQGAYTLNMGGFARTALLGPTAGPSDIQAALIAAFGDTFTVTLPTSFHFVIDFGGQYAGSPQGNLGVVVEQAPPGALTLTLHLDTAALASALRASNGSITVPLEVRLDAAEDGGPIQDMLAFSIPVTIQRPLILPELEETPQTNWLYPFSPKDYIPFGAENVLTGQQFFPAELGDGAATSFSIAHGLDTEYVYVFVRENIDNGRQLVDGTDFRVNIFNSNSVVVTPVSSTPLALSAWIAVVVSARTVAAWASGLRVAEGQVTGLTDDLAALSSRVSTLETLLPAAASSAGSTSSPTNAFTIALSPVNGFLFARDASGNPITDPKQLPARGAYLLPAINNASSSALPIPAPSPYPNALYSVSGPVSISGGGFIRSSTATAFVGSDGRINYPVTQSGTTSTYFPTPFELTLFEMYFNDMMFSPGTMLTVLFKLALQTINADTECQWVLVIEKGLFSADTVGSPNTADPANLGAVTWDTVNRLVSQRLILTSALETHGFGCTMVNQSSYVSVLSSSTSSNTVSVASVPTALTEYSTLLGRSVTGVTPGTSGSPGTITLSGDANQNITSSSGVAVNFGSFPTNGLYYKRVLAANAAQPPCATFALRARLINFDTRDSATNARGWISWALQNPDNGTLGATIQ